MKVRILCSIESSLPNVGSARAGDILDVRDEVGQHLIDIKVAEEDAPAPAPAPVPKADAPAPAPKKGK